ncbi:MAG TPA: hypothetical protein DEB10_00085 [Ruminococcaceae bacterium]|jgi:hypothetical protein|nr:hypothetical protein [Oscillospiraceae bacterium]
MLRENIKDFADGVGADEKEVATVISHTSNTVIFQDDRGKIYYLPSALPELFETGTVARISELDSLDAAEPQLKEKILSILKEGKD